MKTLLLSLSLSLAAMGGAFAQDAARSPAPASEAAESGLSFSGAFIRATLPRAPVGGAYVSIVNHGAEDDRLLAVKAPVGETAEIHEMSHKDGVMTMRALEGGLPIPAGETVSLAPGGFHLMLMGLTAPLKEGEKLELTLIFEKAGEIPVSFDVLSVNARSHPSAAHGEDAHGHDAAPATHDHP